MDPVSSSAHIPSAKSRPWGRRFAAFLLVAIRHGSRWGLRMVFILTLLLAVVFAYLHIVGLPPYLTDVFLDRMAERGYHLQLDRLTLEIDRGLVARNVRMFATPEAPEPFMEAAEFTVMVHPRSFRPGRELTPVLSVVNGSLRVNPGQGRFGARQGSRAVSVDHIDLRFSSSRREFLLRDFSADFLGIHFRGRGAVYFPPNQPAADPGARPGMTNPLAAGLQAIETAPDWLLKAVEQVNAVSFREPPAADFTFALYPAHPEANRVAFRLSNPAGGRVRGVSFDQCQLDVAWQDQQISLPDVQIQKGTGSLGLSGWYNTTNRMVSLHLINTHPPGTFLDLFPEAVRQKAADIVADYRFPLRLELEVGPAPLDKAAEDFRGRLSFYKANVREVPIDNLDVSFSRTGPEVRLDQASIQLDTGPQASRLQMSNGWYRLDTRRFQAEIKGSINPHVIKPLLTPNMRTIVNWFGVQEPLLGDVVIGGVAGNPAIYCYGPVQATNFTIYGAAVQSLEGRLDITNEVMHITGCTLTRPEGAARGDVHMAFSNQTLRLDVDSSLDPRATTKMLGPAIEEFMQPFQLNGPARIRVEGLLDYCNFSLNDLQAQIEARRFGYDRWEADTAAFDMAVRGRRLRFTNAVATAYGGQFTGHGEFYPVATDSQWRYEVELEVQEARLADLLSATLAEPVEELRGILDGHARIGGYVGQGTGPRATGSGQARVRGGFLFQTKLFSGLTAMLSKAIPDFTMFAQTDANGTFTIRNSRVTSRDIELQGTVFGVQAAGDYFFDGSLDYRVEVQLLRGGPVAVLVRLATKAVTQLLEFRLTGTFEDPKWRPVNLNPAELFSGQKEDPAP